MQGSAARHIGIRHGDGDVAVRLIENSGPQRPLLYEPPFHVTRTCDGGVWTEFHRIGRNYLLRFPDLVDFVISADGREASCALAAGVSRAQIEHLWLNQVTPLARSKQGEMVFHGSCVDLGAAAVAFIGESGRGKSTLAASFSSRGHAFLADDGLIVRRCGDNYVACPSHPTLRLWPDSRDAARRAVALSNEETKAIIQADAEFIHCAAPRPLAAVFFLGEDSEEIGFTRLPARETMLQLLKNSFLLDVEDSALTSAHFHRTAAFANRLAGFQFDYPRQFDALDRVTEAIQKIVASTMPTK